MKWCILYRTWCKKTQGPSDLHQERHLNFYKHNLKARSNNTRNNAKKTKTPSQKWLKEEKEAGNSTLNLNHAMDLALYIAGFHQVRTIKLRLYGTMAMGVKWYGHCWMVWYETV